MTRKVVTQLLLLPVLLIASDDVPRGLDGTIAPAGGAAAAPDVRCEATDSSRPGQAPSAEPSAFRRVAALSFDPEGRAGAVREALESGDRPVGAGEPRRSRLESVPGWDVSTDGSGVRIATDPSAPASPPFVAEARYPVGFGDGRSPLFVEREIMDEETSRLYVCLWVKLSDNWQGHGSGVNKIGFVWTDGSPVVAFAAVGTGDGPLIPQIRLQDLPSTVEPARNLVPGLDDATIRRGAWHRWEMLLVMNDWTAANGEAHWWIDGRKVGEHRDLRYVDSTADRIWEKVAWRPTWGGRGDTVREAMSMWLDHLYVSGAP